MTLAAAAVAGADAVLAVGGAQAIAALVVGVGGLEACDAVVGPGNRWVTAAKQLVAGRARIDMLAGPSELLVITYERMQELYRLVPAWRQIAKDVDEMKFNDLMNRSIQLQTLSASERYQLFCEQNNDILQKVALKHSASFLGIDIATLSRIRRNL